MYRWLGPESFIRRLTRRPAPQAKGSGILSCLTTQTTIADAEADSFATAEASELSLQGARPFGYLNPEWEALKARMMDGDELWNFSTPEWTWQALCVHQGIALIRNGEVIAHIVTTLN